jgi:cytoskeletal protein CcmA (bactofilin family)
MAIWKNSTALRQKPEPAPEDRSGSFDTSSKPALASGFAAAPAPRRATGGVREESRIAADVVIEGKIEGGGSVCIAGKFKGNVNLQGDLTVEAGAKLTGSVRADNVTIAGELEGNVVESKHIDLASTAVVIGDLKAASLTVAAGARMRGQVEFGWEEGKDSKSVPSSSDYGVESGASL